jgi:hypothetical protein
MFTPLEVQDALSAKLDELGIYNVTVEEVTFDPENDVVTTEFCDEEDNCVTVQWGFDEGETPYALVVADEDNESIHVDLSPLEPTIMEGEGLEYYLDLTDIEWINLSTIKTILTAGNIMANEPAEMEMGEGAIEEVVFRKVVRGGKIVKIPVRLRKKKLTPKQKAALAKNRKKSHTGAAMKHKAMSLKLRKVKNMK